MNPFSRRALSVLAAGCLVLTACGNDDDTATTETTYSTTSSAEAVTIEVDGDAETPGTQTVPVGTPVTFHITTATEQEFHLHGYDIEDEGTDLTMSFVADVAGEFELESHATETVVFNLVVEG